MISYVGAGLAFAGLLLLMFAFRVGQDSRAVGLVTGAVGLGAIAGGLALYRSGG